jgi:L-ascorbate metabolism protein UlaG (beta-lactamase superfamily)
MKTKVVIIVLFLISFTLSAQRALPDSLKTNNGYLIIQPILHASLVLEWNGKVIYVDPYGGIEAFKGVKTPDIILITDIHGDHTNLETLKSIDTKKAKFVVPNAVAKMLMKDYEKQLIKINNGGMSVVNTIFIRALPMYNLPEDANSKHPKGRGNGYLLNLGGKNIYISGDTEGIREMRKLKRVDVAFVCMNLPYTMDIHQAADAVLDFRPKIVYPYHYRGKPNLSDIKSFKKLVNTKNSKIDVRLRNWYPN